MLGLPLADILQPDILVQEVTGEDRMRERVTLLSQEIRGEGHHGNSNNCTITHRSKHYFL